MITTNEALEPTYISLFQHQNETLSTFSETRKIIDQQIPIMSLSYLYLYVDPTSINPSNIDKQLKQQNGNNVRYPLACSIFHNATIPRTSIQDFEGCELLNQFYSNYSLSCDFYTLKIQLDTAMLPFGDFNNVLLIETLLMSTISCNTIIFSYDEKILETREYKSCLRGQGTGYIYSFDYCSGYWTAFLNGLQYFSKQQSKRALESLTMFQVFSVVGEDEEETPMLCLAYQFTSGDGDMEIRQITDML